MATFSRVKMNKARHKEGSFAKQRKKDKNNEREWHEKNNKISEEDHKERLKKLKDMGIIN